MKYLWLVLTLIFIVSCNLIQHIPKPASAQTPEDITLLPNTPTSTNIPLPTKTSLPTNTPLPTETTTPFPTNIPTPTPIGSGSGSIVFQRIAKNGDDEISDIYLAGIDGSAENNFTKNENVNIQYWYPRWSPDGMKILFFKTEKNPENDQGWFKSELYVMNADGSNMQILSPATQAEENFFDSFGDWSADGASIVFESNRHALATDFDKELFKISISTNEITQLTDESGFSMHPSWSPDGTRIAFMSDRDGDWEIYLMNTDGTGITQLTQNSNSDRFPAWSPDGSIIVFHSDRDGNDELYTITIDGLTESRVTTDPASDTSAGWSPDGNWLVFQSDKDGDEELYIMRADGTEVIPITNNSDQDILADFRP
jgi:Tol biopolymer transport system component